MSRANEASSNKLCTFAHTLPSHRLAAVEMLTLPLIALSNAIQLQMLQAMQEDSFRCVLAPFLPYAALGRLGLC